MLRLLEDIDDATTPGPTTPAALATLASSVVALAVAELETPAYRVATTTGLERMMKTALINNDFPALAQQGSGVAP